MTKNTSSRRFLPKRFPDKDFIDLYEKTYNKAPNQTEIEHFVNLHTTYIEVGKKGADNYKKITVGYFQSTIKEHIETCHETQENSLIKNFVAKIEPKGTVMENLILYVVPAEQGTEAHLLGSVELMIKDDSMFFPYRVCSFRQKWIL